MKYHEYGPVSIAIVGGTRGTQEQVFGKYIGRPYEEYVLIESSERAADGSQTDTWALFNGPDGVTPITKDDQYISNLLDAGLQLCWYEYEQFRAADDAMGDPYP